MFSKTVILSFALATTAFAASATNINGDQFITGPCKGDLACSVGCCAFNTGKCANSIVGQEAEDGGCGFGNKESNSLSAQAFNQGKSEEEIFNFVKSAVASGQIGGGKLDVSSLTGGGAGGAGGAGGNGTAAAGGNAAGGNAAGGDAAGGNAAGQQAATGFQNSDGAGNGQGKQFITGKCLSDADCESGCCDGVEGLCAARLVAQENGNGCGFTPKNGARSLAGKRKMRRGIRNDA